MRDREAAETVRILRALRPVSRRRAVRGIVVEIGQDHTDATCVYVRVVVADSAVRDAETWREARHRLHESVRDALRPVTDRWAYVSFRTESEEAVLRKRAVTSHEQRVVMRPAAFSSPRR